MMFTSRFLATIFSFLFLFSTIFAQQLEDAESNLEYRSLDHEPYEIDFDLIARAPATAAKKTPPPVPAKPAHLQAPKKEPASTSKASTSSASKGKASEAKKSEPYKRPNLLAENAKNMANKPKPDEKKWYQKAADKIKSPFQSKDTKNFNKLYGDKNPSSTPNLKKMINKESEIMTGTKATTANKEKWAKPRYEAKLDRIKPQGDVANAQLAIHNNKWKGVKDGVAVASQLSGIAKNAGMPAIRRRDLITRSLIARELSARALEEYIWG